MTVAQSPDGFFWLLSFRARDGDGCCLKKRILFGLLSRKPQNNRLLVCLIERSDLCGRIGFHIYGELVTCN